MKFQAKSDEYWHFGTLGGGPTHRPHGRYSHPRGVLACLQALPYRGEGTKTPRIRDQEPALCVFRRNGGRIGFRNYMKFQTSNLKFSDTIWIERPLDREIYTGYLIWLHWNFREIPWNFLKFQAESDEYWHFGTLPDTGSQHRPDVLPPRATWREFVGRAVAAAEAEGGLRASDIRIFTYLSILINLSPNSQNSFKFFNSQVMPEPNLRFGNPSRNR